jgi:hypothetical protein
LLGGAFHDVGGRAGNAIQGLLGGSATGGTNAPNATTNRLGGLLQGLGGILGGNAPANTNAPPSQQTTNQSPVNNLLNNLFGPRKK